MQAPAKQIPIFSLLGMMIDVDQARSDTPGCENVIHFNNAGASLMTSRVFNALHEYLEEELMHGGYETALNNHQELESFYTSAAELIGAQPEEIAFTENATLAWDMAFYSQEFSPGDVILTSQIEYASNYIAYLQMAKKAAVLIEPVPSTPSGEVDLDALRDRLAEGGVKMISITHIPTNGGIVNPAEEIGALASEYECLYLIDACQSTGQYPIDVEKLQCDFLSTTGRKYLRGPRGTGFLFARKSRLDVTEPAMLDLHSATWETKTTYSIRPDARRFERWETNCAAKYALVHALDYLLDLGIHPVWERTRELASELRGQLSELEGVEVLDLGEIKSGIVTFRTKAMDSHNIKSALQAKGINTSVAVKNHTLLDMSSREIDSAVRASVHYYNTEQEIAAFCRELEDLL